MGFFFYYIITPFFPTVVFLFLEMFGFDLTKISKESLYRAVYLPFLQGSGLSGTRRFLSPSSGGIPHHGQDALYQGTAVSLVSRYLGCEVEAGMARDSQGCPRDIGWM